MYNVQRVAKGVTRTLAGDNTATQVVITVSVEKYNGEYKTKRAGIIQPLCLKVSYLLRK